MRYLIAFVIIAFHFGFWPAVAFYLAAWKLEDLILAKKS